MKEKRAISAEIICCCQSGRNGLKALMNKWKCSTTILPVTYLNATVFGLLNFEVLKLSEDIRIV